jgi:hypothetical protein
MIKGDKAWQSVCDTLYSPLLHWRQRLAYHMPAVAAVVAVVGPLVAGAVLLGLDGPGLPPSPPISQPHEEFSTIWSDQDAYFSYVFQANAQINPHLFDLATTMGMVLPPARDTLDRPPVADTPIPVPRHRPRSTIERAPRKPEPLHHRYYLLK